MDGMEEGQQRSLLKSHLTQDMRGVLEHVIVIDESVDKTPDAILDKIEENIRKKRNVTVDLVKFDTRTQMQFESAETYLVAIRELAADANLTVDHCNDCKKKCLERRLTARLISGIHDEGTQKKLLAISPFPKLDQVIAKVNAEESAARDNNSLRGREVNRNFTQGQDRSRNSSPSTSSSHPHSPTCNRCGKGEHRSGQTCPAKNQTCNYCNKLGHWEVVCKVKIRDNNGTNNQSSPQQSKRVGRIIINHVAATDHKCPEVTVKITHSSLNVELGEMQAIPDTGAEVCVAGTHAFPKHILNSRYLLPPTSSLFTFNGEKSPCIGILPVRLRNGFHETEAEIYVCPAAKGKMLLSLDVNKRLGYVHTSFPEIIHSHTSSLPGTTPALTSHTNMLPHPKPEAFNEPESPADGSPAPASSRGRGKDGSAAIYLSNHAGASTRPAVQSSSKAHQLLRRDELGGEMMRDRTSGDSDFLGQHDEEDKAGD